jgi:hypothetical protein
MKFSCCAISRSSSGTREGPRGIAIRLLVVALGNGALLETHALQARRFAEALEVCCAISSCRSSARSWM